MIKSYDIPAFVKQLAAEVVDHERRLEEVVDYAIDAEGAPFHLAVLDELGDVDLSEPIPDLTQGWDRVRGQLAYNALERAVRTAVNNVTDEQIE